MWVMGLGLEWLPLRPVLLLPAPPNRGPPRPLCGERRRTPALPPTRNAALVPHSEQGGALKAESPGPASWPCDLGQAERDLSVAHHHHF